MSVCQNCGILQRLLVEVPSCGIGISIGKKCKGKIFSDIEDRHAKQLS